MTLPERTIRLSPAPCRRIPLHFLDKIIEQDCIWGLRHPEGGWALTPSFLRQGSDVYLFWSQRRTAFASVQRQWAEFEPVAIDLQEFIVVWLDDMIARKTHMGLDWDAGVEGVEYDTQAFRRRLCYRLNRQRLVTG